MKKECDKTPDSVWNPGFIGLDLAAGFAVRYLNPRDFPTADTKNSFLYSIKFRARRGDNNRVKDDNAEGLRIVPGAPLFEIEECASVFEGPCSVNEHDKVIVGVFY